MRLATFNQKIYLSPKFFEDAFSAEQYPTRRRKKKEKKSRFLDLTTLLISREEKQCVAGIGWI
jgi:hypothetical protein